MPALPADKSIAHRALLLAAGASGSSRLAGVGRADDVVATESCLRALGVQMERDGDDVVVTPPASLTAPAAPLDAGNAGTCARLLAGWLAGRGVAARITGDASLSRRPMERVAAPVNALFETPALVCAEGGTLPLEVRAARARTGAVVVDTLVPSAQVKSAVILAALGVSAEVRVREAVPTRDHTERMLRAVGAPVDASVDGIRIYGPVEPWEPLRGRLPGDPSAAALLAVGALASGRGLAVEGVGLNPRRTGFVRVLERMGVSTELLGNALFCGEPSGDLRVEAGKLSAVVVKAEEVPGCIDEIPALAALAAIAEGTSRFEGVGELRLKESDRLTGLAEELSAAGAPARVEEDTLVVEGRPGKVRVERVDARGDHRLEMALTALGVGLGGAPRLAAPSMAWVSFPNFSPTLMKAIGR